MEITEVRIKLMEEPGERLQAFCSITFDDCFVVRDLKIIEGASGPFVAMPSRKLTAHCPHCGCKNHLRAGHCNQCGARLKEQIAAKDDEGRAKLYADIAHPINSACREMIQTRVIQAYQEEKSRSMLPGYVPQSYDDFDVGEETPVAASSKPASLESTQIQGAEKPRGPHKIPQRSAAAAVPQHRPAQQPVAPPRNNGGFGAGIFE